METVLLSFIVPVYNVADYLNECIDSIVHQTGPECEIILVDDGSADLSGKICDERAAREPRIRVIHKENGGLSSARNVGLSYARGDYVAFVDSDDRIADKAIPQIIRWINLCGADICFMQTIKFFPDGNVEDLGDGIEYESIHNRSKEQVFEHLSTRQKFSGSACTKVIRKNLLDRHQIRFPFDRRSSEDLIFVLKCLLYAESFDVLPIHYYEYRQNRMGSITNTISVGRYFDLFMFIKESIELLSANTHFEDTIKKHSLAFVAYEYSLLLWHFDKIQGKDRGHARKLLKEYFWLLKYGRNVRLNIIRFVASTIGIGFTSKLLTVYMDHKGSRT